MDLPEPIRLIIWDLDETFWKGTLSEGGIEAFIAENHDLVRALARRGILSSICSKNDHDAVRAVLEQHGLWEYFIFPSIDWTPKGARVAAMVEAIGLRPPTVMFIDDNPSNRGEVAAAVPGIVVADELFVPGIAGHPMFQGKDDTGLSRLAQYKLLEQKKRDEVAAEVAAPGSNTEFLRSCAIQVTIEHDLDRHIDRVVELINRTNQLNFTKQRLPDDPEAARAAARAQLRFFGHQAGLVRVSDRYGDYGYVGFYLKTLDERMHAGVLKHFCFSCRTLGMGIEQWVYQALGKPELHVVGEVLSDVHTAAPVDWVNQAGGIASSARSLAQFSAIRLRGGCEISAMAHYFKVAGPVTVAETNFSTDIFIVKQDMATHLVNVLRADPALNSAWARLEWPAEALTSDFMAPTSGPTLLVLNTWGELHIPRYRHRTLGFHVHLTVTGFMGWGETFHGGDIAAWTDEALDAQALAQGLDPALHARLRAVVAELRRDYEFAGVIQDAEVKANLHAIAERIPANATLALLLPSATSADGTANYRNTLYNAWCREALGDRPNVLLIDIDGSIHSPSDRLDIGDHFDRIVYYRVAEDIMRQASALALAAERSDVAAEMNDAAALIGTEAVVFAEPIRLVIWDLDDTFWKGTLTEGGIEAFIEANHALVPELARRGIVSSVCSKNDHDAVRTILQEHGLWDYFIFPSIDWSPKGGRIAAMVEAVGLRAPTVMFIDDNPNNRGEVAAAVPGIVVASERFIPQIATHPMFRGKDDRALTRLAQYKLLEQKKQDQVSAQGSNIEFLRSCEITVKIDHDVEKHLERVVELINRTNQLNFTKRRLPDDPEKAAEEALRQIRYYNNQAGLVRVTDRYGDYGFVGFYLNKTMFHEHPPGELEHFCFSCRTIGMGIEQFVYQQLGRPWLWPIGEVLSDVKGAPVVDWINQAGGGRVTERRNAQFSEIRLRGGCEMTAMAHYFRMAGDVTCVEANFRHDIFLIRRDTAASLVNLLTLPPDQVAALGNLEIPSDGLRSDFFAPTSGPTLLVSNFWGDLHNSFYRHKCAGFDVPLLPLEHLDWTESHVAGDIAAWTDDELAARADKLGLDETLRGRVDSLVAELRQNYVFGGQVTEEVAKKHLLIIAEHIPPGAIFALILPSRFMRDGSENVRNAQYGRWCHEVLDGRSNVHLVELDHSIHSLDEHAADLGDHFDRIVYARVAEDLLGGAGPLLAGSKAS